MKKRNALIKKKSIHRNVFIILKVSNYLYIDLVKVYHFHKEWFEVVLAIFGVIHYLRINFLH